jgi:hypothetical protein
MIKHRGHTLVIRGLKANVIVVISSPWMPPCLAGSSFRSVVTYGLATHATSPVLTPDVETAVNASAARANIGRLDSITNMKGASVQDSVNEANENNLSLRNVAVNGPWYRQTSSLVDVDEVLESWVFVPDVDEAVASARDIRAHEKALVGIQNLRVLV